MTLKKLLLASAMVAAAATSANALTLVVNNPAANVVPANELAFPSTDNVQFQFDLAVSSGAFPAGNNIVVDIVLPTGIVFNTPATATNVSVTPGGAGGNVSATVQGGSGQPGTNTVQFLVSIPQTPSITSLRFGLDVELGSCPTAVTPLSVTARTEAGTNIEQGTVSPAATANQGIAPCRSAFGVAVFDDNAPAPGPAGTDSFIQLPTYVSLNNGNVGQINGTIRANTARGLSNVAADATDVNNAVVPITFPDVTGLASFTFNGSTFQLNNTAGSLTGPRTITVNTNLTADGTAGFFTGGNDVVVSALAANVPINAQQISVGNVTFQFTDANANFIASETNDGGNLDLLQREGQSFGFFDWVGGRSTGTITVLRATGLPQTSPTNFTVTFQNSVPASANGTYTGTFDPAAQTGDLAGTGEFQMISSSGFGAMNVPDYIRADVLVNFETPSPMDVDRLLARGGIITDFGDEANTTNNAAVSNVPINDSDATTE